MAGNDISFASGKTPKVVSQRLQELADTVNEIMEPIILAAARDLKAKMENAAPVSSGKLKGNFSLKAGRLRNASWVDIKNRTRYAAFVEYGTEKAVATPYMRPIAQGNKRKIWAQMKAGATRAVERKTAILGAGG